MHGLVVPLTVHFVNYADNNLPLVGMLDFPAMPFAVTRAETIPIQGFDMLAWNKEIKGNTSSISLTCTRGKVVPEDPSTAPLFMVG